MASRSSRIALALVAATAWAVAGLASQTQPPSATERVAERIRALQREADSLALQEKTLLVELRKLEVERRLKIEEIARTDEELRQTQQLVAATIQRTNALRKTAATDRPDVEARLVHLYKMGRAGYWRLLLDVDDARSIGRAYRTASALTQIDRDRVLAYQRTLETLAKERASLEARVRAVSALQQKAAAARAALDRAVASRAALVESIDARRDLNAQLTGDLQAAQQRLNASVSQLGGRGSATVSLPLKPFRGALPWPANGVVISRFGPPPPAPSAGQTPAWGTVRQGRNGIEISIAEGRPVRAVHEGTVAFADPYTGYGNLVIVDHGDSAYSLYGHLDALDVKKGDHVDPQTRLGSSGRNPNGNPALYFELRIDAKPVDPLQWLKR